MYIFESVGRYVGLFLTSFFAVTPVNVLFYQILYGEYKFYNKKHNVKPSLRYTQRCNKKVKQSRLGIRVVLLFLNARESTCVGYFRQFTPTSLFMFCVTVYVVFLLFCCHYRLCSGL